MYCTALHCTAPYCTALPKLHHQKVNHDGNIIVPFKSVWSQGIINNLGTPDGDDDDTYTYNDADTYTYNNADGTNYTYSDSDPYTYDDVDTYTTYNDGDVKNWS